MATKKSVHSPRLIVGGKIYQKPFGASYQTKASADHYAKKLQLLGWLTVVTRGDDALAKFSEQGGHPLWYVYRRRPSKSK
jgi:hypothetical protein